MQKGTEKSIKMCEARGPNLQEKDNQYALQTQANKQGELEEEVSLNWCAFSILEDVADPAQC